MSVLLAALVSPAAGQEPSQAGAQDGPAGVPPVVEPPAAGEAPENPELRVDEERLRRLIRDEVQAAESRPAAEEPEWRRQLDLFEFALDVQLFVVTLLSVLGAVAGWFGISRWRKIDEAAKRAEHHADEIEHHLRNVSGAAEQLVALSRSAGEIQQAVVEKVDQLFAAKRESGELDVVLGERPPPLEPRLRAQFEDLDGVLLDLFHLDVLPDREAASRAFIKLGRLWRHQLEFGRSVERIRLAGELAPDQPLVQGHLAVTLSNWAGWESGLAVEERSEMPSELLSEAWTTLEPVFESHQVQRMDLLNLRGTLLHVQEKFEEASETFRQALKAPEAPLEGQESLVDSTPDAVRYNLAASLCRAGHLTEARKELERLPPDLQADAERDPDFQALRTATEEGG